MLNLRNRVMAYTPLPKLVPIGSPRITPVDVAKNMITEVLKSEPVKRLLSQPNIVLKAISLAPSNRSPIYPSTSKNNISGNVIQIKEETGTSVTLSNLHLDDEANFLPSKRDGKSEVALLPIKRTRKKCGHYGPCENIICDVNFQQFVDYNGSSPILAVNIEESEINAPVSKHCSNPLCDALSIDHNRCRRAVICLWHYDKSNACDICGISLKTRKSRFNHKNCKQKNIYQHNNVDNAQILRERMRMKELQMMAALKMKKNNYSDPSTADDKAIEILKNNSELIVIPKTTTKITTVQPPSTFTVKTILNHNESINSFFGNSVLPNKGISILSQSANSTISRQIDDQRKHQEIVKKNENQKLNNNTLSKLQNGVEKHSKQRLNKKSPSKLMEPETTNDVKSVNSQCIVTGVPPQGTVSYPLSKNDWIMAHTAVTPIPSIQKPYLMPVRVVPIANLKSKPSLLHQTQGIARFCIIADNSATGQSLVNLPTISTVSIPNIQTSTPVVASSVSVPASIVSDPTGDTTRSVETSTPESTETNLNSKGEKKMIESSSSKKLKLNTSRRHYGDRNKKRVEKKLFICTYCSKRFLTEWYFKMHIARHIGEVRATCELCEKKFTHHYDLKRHVNTEHNHIKTSTKKDSVIDMDEEEMEQDSPMICNNCEYSFSSRTEMAKHKCKKIVNNDTNNSDVGIIDSVENECNEEIEKENGITRQRIEDTLPILKLREIVRSHKKIIKKNVHGRRNKNKRFNAGSDEVSSDTIILKS